jgi:hypothetical protein
MYKKKTAVLETKLTTVDENVDVDYDQIDSKEVSECDIWGVKHGIREYKFHWGSAFKRAGGLSDVYRDPPLTCLFTKLLFVMLN